MILLQFLSSLVPYLEMILFVFVVYMLWLLHGADNGTDDHDSYD